METAERVKRADNRHGQLLDAAAELFAAKGYHATSVRDIAASVGMLPGSIYYHFSSKEELFAAVYEEGVRQISAAARAQMATESDPWRRLEAAAAGHLEALLKISYYPQVLVLVLPRDLPGSGARLAAARARHEDIFRDLIEELPLPIGADRRMFRLALLGALNGTTVWYRPGGESPRMLARRILRLFRDPLVRA